MRKKLLITLSLVGMLSILASSPKADAAWKANSNGRYYTTNSAKGYLTGWQKIGKYKYYFDSKGYASVGWKSIKSHWYYFGSTGKMLTNVWVDSSYLTASGKMAKDTTIDGIKIGKNGVRIASSDSAADSATVTDPQSCWVTIDRKTYYYNYKGNIVTGLMNIRNETYYLDPKTGVRKTGIIKIQKKKYFFDPQTGLQKTGWITYNGNTYFFSRKTKYSLTGWQKINKQYYYFDSNGILLKTAWLDKKYYVDDTGKKLFGFQKIGGYTYYLNPNTGIRAKGLTKINKDYYHFNSYGRMTTATWVKGKYFQTTGKMAKKKWVGTQYVDSSGIVTKTRNLGFYTDGGKTYYLKDDLTLVKAEWFELDSKWYYFDSKGVLLKDSFQDEYYVGKDGARIVNQFYVIKKVSYLFLEDGTIAKGLVTYETFTYYLDPMTGAMKTGFQLIDDISYYFKPETGAMAADETLIIDNSVYVFSKTGTYNVDTASTAKGVAIAAYAKKFVGYPYSSSPDPNSTDITKGVDCSRFTQLVMAHFGINIPRTSQAQALGTSSYGGPFAPAKFISKKDILPGDLIIYYSDRSHVGIYIGDGKIVHASNSAPYPAGGIKISAYDYTTIAKIVRYW